MSYVLELSGVVSYTDNSESSFLAVDDIRDNIIIQDPQAFGDVNSIFKTLMIKAGGEMALPRTTLKTSKTARKVNAKISCWYTIGQASYELCVTQSDTTGLIMTGDGNITQFMNNYGNQANNFINRVIKGSAIFGTRYSDPALAYIKNGSATFEKLIVGFYSQINPTLELITEKVIDPNNEGAWIFDRNGVVAPWVHVRPFGDPPPQPIDVNTQVSFLGVLQVDAVVGPGPTYNIGLTNAVFA